MRRLSLAVAAALAASPAPAQEAITVAPGGIATVIAIVDVPPGDSIAYTLSASPDVRLFARPEGSAFAGDDGRIRLPFTFGLPARAPGGPFTVGRLDVRHADGGRSQRELIVRVLPVRDVSFWVGADTAASAPGEPLEFGYRLRNRGNVLDTFRVSVVAPSGWVQRVTPSEVGLAPGDTAAGIIRLIPPQTASRGAQHLVKVVLDAPELRRTAAVTVVVVGQTAWVGGLAHLPGSVFLGSSTGPGAVPGVAVTAGGEIRPGTYMALAVRHTDAIAPPTAFRGALSGPRLRIALNGRQWSMQAGDIFVPGSVFTGPTQAGRGVEAAVRRGSLSTGARVAVPTGFGGSADEGHLLDARVAWAGRYGELGARLSSVTRRSDFLEDYSLVGAGVTYRGSYRNHSLQADAGLVAIATDSARRSGFAGSANYRLSWEGGAVIARLQSTPGATRRTASQPREAFVSSTLSILPGLEATGWGFVTEAPLITGDPYSMSRGGAAGLRFDLPWRASARVVGQVRRSEQVGGSLPVSRRRSIRTGVDAPLGGLRLESDLDLGTVTTDSTRPFRLLRIGTRWSTGGQWAWLGLSHYDAGTSTPSTGVDLSGSIGVGPGQLHGGINLALSDDFSRGFSLWSGFTVPIRSLYDISAGVDYRGAAPDPWRLSLGVGRKLGIPLPLPRRAVVQGIVFEDADGDRVLDAGEARLPGVEVLFGALRTTTDHQGRFRFFDEGRGQLRLSASTLPRGVVVPADLHFPTAGTVDIPVIRTASLRLRVFFDRDRDGKLDPAESVAAGALVSLLDGRERQLDLPTDQDGRVRFDNLAPGEYTVIVHSPGFSPAPARPFETRLFLAPGAREERTLAVPLRQREIRMPGGSTAGGRDTTRSGPAEVRPEPSRKKGPRPA